MGFFGSKQNSSSISWIDLTNMLQLKEIDQLSCNHPILIFKHSTRCSINAMALGRLEREWSNINITPYYLDLLTYRNVSNEIASYYNIQHESPQAILIKEGKAIYHASHSAISYKEITQHLF